MLDLTIVPEYELETRSRERRYVDGPLLHTLRVPFGYWEAKDEKDDLDAEIGFKTRRGRPKTNIVFEDSAQAVAIQNGEETMRCAVGDVAQLEELLRLFFGYQRPEIEAFRKAAGAFLKHAQEAINPSLIPDAVREMLIQHILAVEVFAAVFPGTTYNDEDYSVARELQP